MKLWDDDTIDEADDEDSGGVEIDKTKEMLKNPSQHDTSSRREYIAPTKEEFEECLKKSGKSWSIEHDEDSKEYVYESYELLPDYDYIVLRIYSTIDQRTDKAREKGSDAIRLVIWHKVLKQPIGGRKKTLRIKTYCKNLLSKIEDVFSHTEEYVVVCDECGDFMVVRDGQYGEFLGCSNYPDCTNTEQLPD